MSSQSDTRPRPASNGVKIRKATTRDFPDVAKLIKHYPGTLIQNHLPRPSEFFIAIQDNSIVGCCALEIYSKRLAEIRSLAVAKRFQRRGIATQLIETCVRYAKKKNIYELLTVTGAPKLFKKHGFGTFKNEKFALIKMMGK